jgi:glycosyltransferase involved in cell wall biosynthesis
MRILIANDHLGELGGAEISAQLTRELLEEHDHNVVMFGSVTGESFGSFFSRWFSWRNYCQMKKLINEFQPDIMHANSVSRIISPSVLMAAQHRNIPILMTIRDPHLFCAKSWAVTKDFKECPGFSWKCWWRCQGSQSGIFAPLFYAIKYCKVSLHRHLIRRCCRLFISPSRKLLEMAQRELKLNNKQIAYLPNFISPLPHTHSAEKDCEEQRLLFVGRLSSEKGLTVALKAISQLIREENIAKLRFDIAGSGPMEQELTALVTSLNLSEHVNLIGRVPNDELQKYYRRACAVLIPSLWMENNPRVALEAMSYSRPIVASNIGGLPDLVQNGQSGFLCLPGSSTDLASKVKRLCQNKELALQMGAAGRAKLEEEFSREKHYQDLLKLYQDLIG